MNLRYVDDTVLTLENMEDLERLLKMLDKKNVNWKNDNH